MDQSRDDMMQALRTHVVPRLRAMGFKGSFPHFYRDTDNFVDLVFMQFFSAGGSFCVNLGYADPARNNVYFQPEAPANKLRVPSTRDQKRLGALNGGDNWFSFGRASTGNVRGTPEPCVDLAIRVAEMLENDGEAWWRGRRLAIERGETF